MGLVIRRARLGDRLAEVRLEGGRITEVGAGIAGLAGDEELDAAGGAVLPGLHDHHLHLRAAAAAHWSVPTGPPEVTDRAGLAAALRAQNPRTPAPGAAASGAAALPEPPVAPAAGGWLRGVGYHESVAGPLDRAALDELVADRPVRIQHRGGSLWMLNSLAVMRLGLDCDPAPGIERDAAGRPTGRLWRMDRWLADRLAAAGEALADGAGDLAGLSRAALALGVTGWTDATPDRAENDTWSLARAVEEGQVAQRLHLMLPAATPAATIKALGALPGVSVGPVKVLLDDIDLPTLDGLAASIAAAHSAGRPVAVHCVTPVQVVLTAAALGMAGPQMGDRIEHGALIPAGLLPNLFGLGVTVVTQPNFVHERGDAYLSDVDADDFPDLWRARSLTASGIGLAAGTDAPFGSLDPWVAVRAATQRRTSSGQSLGPAEAVSEQEALRWWSGPPEAPQRRRRVAVGEPGDLVVLAAPLTEALAGEGPVPVAATVINGVVVSHPE